MGPGSIPYGDKDRRRKHHLPHRISPCLPWFCFQLPEIAILIHLVKMGYRVFQRTKVQPCSTWVTTHTYPLHVQIDSAPTWEFPPRKQLALLSYGSGNIGFCTCTAFVTGRTTLINSTRNICKKFSPHDFL